STGNVIIQQLSAGRAIDLGTETAGQLSLTDAELDRIAAGAIGIGDGNSGTVTISAAIDRAVGSTTTISLIAGNDKNIAFGSGGSLDAKNGNVTLTTNATKAGAIISGNATTDITGANLALVSGSGGIGASGNPLTFAASNLNSITFAANQF